MFFALCKENVCISFVPFLLALSVVLVYLVFPPARKNKPGFLATVCVFSYWQIGEVARGLYIESGLQLSLTENLLWWNWEYNFLLTLWVISVAFAFFIYNPLKNLIWALMVGLTVLISVDVIINIFLNSSQIVQMASIGALIVILGLAGLATFLSFKKQPVAS